MVMELLQARDAQGDMLRLWTGDGSSIQADRGQTRLLQGLFPEAPGIEGPILEAFFRAVGILEAFTLGQR